SGVLDVDRVRRNALRDDDVMSVFGRDVPNADRVVDHLPLRDERRRHEARRLGDRTSYGVDAHFGDELGLDLPIVLRCQMRRCGERYQEENAGRQLRTRSMRYAAAGTMRRSGSEGFPSTCMQ